MDMWVIMKRKTNQLTKLGVIGGRIIARQRYSGGRLQKRVYIHVFKNHFNRAYYQVEMIVQSSAKTSKYNCTRFRLARDWDDVEYIIATFKQTDVTQNTPQ